ncbi:hypothetical protein BJY01DRAFT_240864 [Aspergillus pseudoustus]|uniref:6-methylsalicylate decarboxylase n=1 Tax=Aspergillus pseudoustus TaxID=1810923 RepID=A0ABR4ILD6_9EURO
MTVWFPSNSTHEKHHLSITINRWRRERSWWLTDTHIHVLPPAYLAALEAAGGDPSGYPTPSNWSVDGAIASLALTKSARGILSLSTPGIPIAGTGEEARKLCREVNLYMASIVKQHPANLGCFGALPDWRDVDGTLAEIDFIFSTQKAAFGVGFYTSYGDLLPGNSMFQPIWEKLESYKALTFMHPGVMDVQPLLIGDFLPQPIIDYPQATTRAAVDLVFSGVRSATPNVDVILSHAGGTLPFLAQRAWGSLLVSGIANEASVNSVEALAEFRRFYYDIALSTSKAQLDGLIASTDLSHILMGSDYPYAPAEAIAAGFAEFVAYTATQTKISAATLTKNAIELMQKHSPLM